MSFGSAPDTPADFQQGKILSGNTAADALEWTDRVDSIRLGSQAATAPTATAVEGSIVQASNETTLPGHASVGGGSVESLGSMGAVFGWVYEDTPSSTATVSGNSYLGGFLSAASRCYGTGSASCVTGEYSYAAVSVLGCIATNGIRSATNNAGFNIVTMDANAGTATNESWSSVLALVASSSGEVTTGGSVNVGAVWARDSGSTWNSITDASIYAAKVVGASTATSDGDANLVAMSMDNNAVLDQDGSGLVALGYLDEGTLIQQGLANIANVRHVETVSPNGAPSTMAQYGAACILNAFLGKPTIAEESNLTFESASTAALLNIHCRPRVQNFDLSLDGQGVMANMYARRGTATFSSGSRGLFANMVVGRNTNTGGVFTLGGEGSSALGLVYQSAFEVSGVGNLGVGAAGMGGSGDDLLATGVSNCFQFGPGVNLYSDALGVGETGALGLGVRLCFNGKPAVPVEGDLYKVGGYFYIHDADGELPLRAGT